MRLYENRYSTGISSLSLQYIPCYRSCLQILFAPIGHGQQLRQLILFIAEFASSPNETRFFAKLHLLTNPIMV